MQAFLNAKLNLDSGRNSKVQSKLGLMSKVNSKISLDRASSQAKTGTSRNPEGTLPQIQRVGTDLSDHTDTLIKFSHPQSIRSRSMIKGAALKNQFDFS